MSFQLTRRSASVLPTSARSAASFSRPGSTRRAATRLALGVGTLFLGSLAGCTRSGSDSSEGYSGTYDNGSLAVNPQSGGLILAEARSSGVSSLRIERAYWGRLVDVFDWANPSDPDSVSSVPVITDFVVSSDIVGETDSFKLVHDPLTERQQLQIKAPRNSIDFHATLLAAEENVQVLVKKGLDPSELPPFTAVPRNSALVLQFNAMLDDGGSPSPTNQEYPGSVNPETVRLLTGYAPTLPFEARIFPDPVHGNVINGVYHASRVIIDFSVSEDDSLNTGLPVNALGLPEAVNVSQPNCVVRIPTRVNGAAQQFEVLRSIGGRALSFTGNGPTDSISPTLDVLRSFRSGGKAVVTGDAHNGFLQDTDPPFLLGVQPITVISANNPSGDLTEFDITVQFASVPCTISPKKGDLINISGGARVATLADYTGTLTNGVVGPMRVRAICATCNSLPSPGNVGEFVTTFTGLGALQLPEFGACFLRFSPAGNLPPNGGIPTNATIGLRFSEPIDPTTVAAFDTFTVKYGNNQPQQVSPLPPLSPIYANVVGQVLASQDLRRFTFQPVLPLRKINLGGTTENRFDVEVLGGVGGVTDLAGNPLAVGLEATPFKISNGAANVDSAGVSLKFNTGDEDGDGNPEVRGQILYDIQRGLVRPRSVTRFSAVCDTSVPVVGSMIPFTGPVQTPLSQYGSKLMGIWRYHDLGFSLRDETNQNIDVEGLWWTPFSGSAIVDNFSQFQISLAHSKFLPDEELSSGLLPNWIFSGLTPTPFEGNLLDKTGDPLTIVHPKARGYTVNPADVTLTSTNNTIAPWPLNRNLPQSQFAYWTWRDTGTIQVAAPNGDGVDTQRLQQVTKTAQNKFYKTGKVPTIGLPLLMEFRTYQDATASGQNGFKVALAINSSARPFFRVFSTGGVNPNNPAQIKLVDPDNEPNATGAYSQNGNGAPGNDNVVYYGQADFIVRVSRMHTIWFDSLAAGTFYSNPVVEPSSALLPAGTQVALAFRGATTFTFPATPPTGVLPYVDAGLIDAYGDGYTETEQMTHLALAANLRFVPQFLGVPTDKSWKSNIATINGARFFQARATFISNVNTSLIPELSAIGFAFRR